MDRIDAYAAALLEIAKAEGSLETVEDELFKVARELALIAESSGAGAEEPTAERRAIAQQAIEVLQEAVAAGFKKLDQVKTDPQFKVLAGDPAFTQLLEQHPTP